MKPSVILMGSKPGSIVALRLMLERGWNITYVVTTPDIKHDWIEGPSLTEEAKRLGLPVLSQEELPRSTPVDFVISYMFRKLVRSDVIKLAKRGALNFHAGPLPRYGGWAFYNVAILENATEYGCTCHYMDNGFDTGPILRVNTFPIDPSIHTAASLERAAQREMVRLFVDFLDLAEDDAPLPSLPQCPEEMRYLSKQDFMKLKEIPASSNKETADRYARAFWYPPYECAYINTGSARAEVVPQIAKAEYAKILHIDDLSDLLDAAHQHKLSGTKLHSSDCDLSKSTFPEIAAFKNECATNIATYSKDDDWKRLSSEWMIAAFRHKYMYNFESLGRPIIQTPVDMVAMQELIWSIKPDLIIETGIAHGGSLIFSASMLALLDMCDAIEAGEKLVPKISRRKVLGIDIDIRAHNRAAIEAHPMSTRIQMIQGSSIAPDTIEQVKQVAKDYQRVLVCLDSNHTHDHVLAELEAYAPLTSVGSYCVVFDTIIEDMPADMFPDRPWGSGNNPKTAVWEYLKTHPEFEINKGIQHKLLITVAPDGYLKRVK